MDGDWWVEHVTKYGIDSSQFYNNTSRQTLAETIYHVLLL